MDYLERKRFRHSNAWKAFKEKIRLKHSIDAITKEFLVKGWNLHHLDLNTRRYDILEPEKFACLNPKTHEVIHEVYKWYRKDKKVLERMKDILEKMEEYSSKR